MNAKNAFLAYCPLPIAHGLVPVFYSLLPLTFFIIDQMDK